MSTLANDGRPTAPSPAGWSPGGPAPAGWSPAGPAPLPAPPRTDPLAVVGLVAAFVAPAVGLVLGLVARRRIARSGEGGRGLATAAAVIGGVLSALWIGIVVVAIAVGGSFSASFTTASVPASSVQSQVVAATGLSAGSVSCPAELPAQVGASTVCAAVVDGTSTPVDVTVTSVDGDDVRFHIASR